MPPDPAPRPGASLRSLSRRRWFPAFLLLAAGHVAVSAFLLPAAIEATLSRLPPSADDADRKAVAAMLQRDESVRMVFLPVRLGAGLAAFAVWLMFLCRLFTRGPLPRYPFFLAIVVQAELFVLLGRGAAALRAHWFPAADPARDLLPPFSLAGWLPASAGDLLVTACSAVNPFAALSVGTLALGLCAVCGLRPLSGTLAALLAWAGATLAGLGLLTAAQAFLGVPR